MKNLFGVMSICAATVFASAHAYATEGWVQIPGAATEIAVGASDIPYVLDVNGNVDYLSPSTLDCSTPPLCTMTERQWVSMNFRASHISADLYGYLRALDAGNQIWLNTSNNRTPFSTLIVPTGLAACATSMAPGHWRNVPAPLNYPFGSQAGTLFGDPNTTVNVPYGTTFITGCGAPSMSSIDTTEVFHWDSHDTPSTQLTNGGWQAIDTGELQVALFTVDGSADQVPWFFHTAASGNNVAYAYHSGIYTYASAPSLLGTFFSISYMTDHYVVANQTSHKAVYKWMGNAFGGGPNAVWSLLPNSTDVPSGGHIVQIAYASALPGTSVGTVGPSHLYMVDSNNFIYQWGNVGDVVK